MWRLNSERTPTPLPRLPLPHSFFTVSHSLRSSPSVSKPSTLNLFVVLSQTRAPNLASDTFYPLFSLICFIVTFTILPTSYSPSFHGNPLLSCCYINLTLVPTLFCFLFFFTRSYAIFCYAWRIHLACGRSGSDGYISLGGGSWLSGEWLASPVPSGLCAC